MSLSVDVLPVDPLPKVRILVDLPTGRSWKVVGRCGDSEWLAGEGRSRGAEQAFADPWAPLGRPATYELTSEGTTNASGPVLRSYRGQHAITDLAGRTVVDFLWEKDGRDPWDLEPRGEFLDIPGAALPVTLGAPTAGAGTGSVPARTVGVHTRALRRLVQANRRLLILHNHRVCHLPDCDVPDVQTVKLTAAPSELTGRADRAERRWALAYRHVGRPWRYLAPVATGQDVVEEWATIADMLADVATGTELVRGGWSVTW